MVSEYKLSLAEKLMLCVLVPVIYVVYIPLCLVVSLVYPAPPIPPWELAACRGRNAWREGRGRG